MQAERALNFIDIFTLNAIVYFDLFEYPLTTLEVWRFLYTNGMSNGRCTLKEVIESLEQLQALHRIESHDGFHMLVGRANIVQTRRDRYVIADRKLKRARRAASILRYLPFVRAVCVCNNLGTHNVRTESDIDLFIITKRGRLFLTRALVTIVVQLLGLRRHGARVADRLCLSFYVTDDALDMRSLQIGEDIYLRYWIATVLPIYDRGGYGDFITANPWISAYLPHTEVRAVSMHRRVEDSVISRALYRTLEILLWGPVGDLAERIARITQLSHMRSRERVHAHPTDVIISDHMLKFHEHDRRMEYAEAWEARVATLMHHS